MKLKQNPFWKKKSICNSACLAVLPLLPQSDIDRAGFQVSGRYVFPLTRSHFSFRIQPSSYPLGLLLEGKLPINFYNTALLRLFAIVRLGWGGVLGLRLTAAFFRSYGFDFR
jgi:hypothetical protein